MNKMFIPSLIVMVQSVQSSMQIDEEEHAVCVAEMPSELNDEQKDWLCRFRQFFKEEDIEELKACECFDDKDWKKNFSIMIHRFLSSDCESYQFSLKKIIDAKLKSNDTLVLKNLILTHLPPDIVVLDQLTSIYLTELDIHYLPKTMQGLTQLTNLVITKCPLYDIPDWIGNLSQLNQLTCSRTRIHKLPESLTQCKSLKQLNVKYNWIKVIPSWIEQLTELERLDIEGNPAIIEWNKDTKMTKLYHLNIGETNVKMIPKTILDQLISLHWTGVKGIQFCKGGENTVYKNFSGSTVIVE